MDNKIDVYILDNSNLKETLDKLNKDKSNNFNFIKQTKIDFRNKKSSKIIIFEEKSYIESSALFDKIIKNYRKKPASILISSNKEVFNVVNWMRKGASDYLIKGDFTKEILLNSIKGSIELYKPDKKITKKDKSDKFHYTPIIIPSSTNWGSLVNDQKYDIAVVMIETFLQKEIEAKYSKAAIEDIYLQVKLEAKKMAQLFGGKLWLWHNNFGVLVFHFGDYIDCACLAGISFYHNFFLFCVEQLKLREIFHFKIGLNEGYGIFNNKNTENITSHVINTLSHLTKKHTKDCCFNITGNTYKKLNKRLLPHFHNTGTFDNNKIYKYKFYEY